MTLRLCPLAPRCRTWINRETPADADRALAEHLSTAHSSAEAPRSALTDEQLLEVYNAAWNQFPWGTPSRECERAALRAVHDAARAASPGPIRVTPEMVEAGIDAALARQGFTRADSTPELIQESRGSIRAAIEAAITNHTDRSTT